MDHNYPITKFFDVEFRDANMELLNRQFLDLAMVIDSLGPGVHNLELGLSSLLAAREAALQAICSKGPQP